MSARQNLSAALAAKAAAELNEDPTEYDHYLDTLRKWLSQQTTFKSRTDDDFLIAFLRAAKFSLEVTKTRLECFYRYRATLPQLFENRDINDPKLLSILKSGCVVHLPETLVEDESRVLMMRPQFFDMEKHSIEDVYRAVFMGVDTLLYSDYQVQIAGYTVILDLANVPKEAWAQFDLGISLKLLDILNKHIFPARFKAAHIINTPTIFEKFYFLIKGAISEKLKARFFVHGNTDETLYDHIPRNVLPKEYGGPHDIETLQVEIHKRILEKAHILAEEAQYGMLDSCAQTSYKSCGNSFGVNGSFRKMNID